ncbi:SRPBCC family protein [Alkalihalobacillus sp. MEB130]|uniref:CoxG family protein n=1 Tax=Alkalihalobacillus sp. MEB130 TaxID=2976704 RepID=UPI0028DD7316|nr:SRPBCC family protein [Alkalihalobacillus sp. MEB130]MDT8860123.1 SRPBCC family protein [Alkalihalobacillus sp. MEB130]
MPVASESGNVNCNIDTMWEFIKEMENWAPCMPGYVSFQKVDTNVSIWALKGDMGILKRTMNFKVTVTERVKPERVAFKLEAQSIGIKGEGSYRAVRKGTDMTEVEFYLDMSGTGIPAKVVNVLLSKTLPRDCKELKENLIEVLEKDEM